MTSEEITSLVNVVFGTPHGRKLATHLDKTIVDRPTYKKGMELDEVAFREGQKNIVNQLLKELPNG